MSTLNKLQEIAKAKKVKGWYTKTKEQLERELGMSENSEKEIQVENKKTASKVKSEKKVKKEKTPKAPRQPKIDHLVEVKKILKAESIKIDDSKSYVKIVGDYEKPYAVITGNNKLCIFSVSKEDGMGAVDKDAHAGRFRFFKKVEVDEVLPLLKKIERVHAKTLKEKEKVEK